MARKLIVSETSGMCGESVCCSLLNLFCYILNCTFCYIYVELYPLLLFKLDYVLHFVWRICLMLPAQAFLLHFKLHIMLHDELNFLLHFCVENVHLFSYYVLSVWRIRVNSKYSCY